MCAGKSLLFAKNPNQPNEIWVPVLEKAFAKLYSSWEAIKGGHAEEATMCLFGGVTEGIQPARSLGPVHLWEQVRHLLP